MIKHQLFIAVALFVGVGIGYCVKSSGSDDSVQIEKKSAKTKSVVSNKGDAASLRALRYRIAELEKQLAEKQSRETAVQARPPEPPRQNWNERMEAMKKNDPARYAQMTNRFAQWRARRAEQAQSKYDFLSSIDVSKMSAEAQKTHSDLQNLIERREDLEEQLQQEGLSNDARRKLFDQMRETDRSMWRLNQQERRNLIDEAARNLGFKGEEARDFSATIQEVIRATDNGWGRPWRRGPGGPGGR